MREAQPWPRVGFFVFHGNDDGRSDNRVGSVHHWRCYPVHTAGRWAEPTLLLQGIFGLQGPVQQRRTG